MVDDSTRTGILSPGAEDGSSKNLCIVFREGDRWGEDATPQSPCQLMSPVRRRSSHSIEELDEEEVEYEDESTLESLRKFKSETGSACFSFSPSTRSTSKSNSVFSKTTCSTDQESDDDEDDRVKGEASQCLEELGAPLISLVDYNTGDFVELPDSDDEFTFVTYDSEGSMHSQKTLTTHSQRTLDDYAIEKGDSSCGDTVMKTIEEDVALVHEEPIDFEESRSIISHRLLERTNSDPLLVTRNGGKGDLASTLSPPNHLGIRRRIKIERYGGERRRKSFKKSRHLIEKMLGKCPHQSPISRGREGRMEASQDRRKSFDQTKKIINKKLEKVLSPQGRAFVNTISGSFENGVLSTEYNQASDRVSAERRLYLKHRIKVETLSGERRRNAFERTKRILSTKLVKILTVQQEAETKAHLLQARKGVASVNPSVGLSPRRGKTHWHPPKASLRTKEQKERMGGLLRARSYKKSRKMFEDRTGLELCKKATGDLREGTSERCKLPLGKQGDKKGSQKKSLSSPTRKHQQKRFRVSNNGSTTVDLQ